MQLKRDKLNEAFREFASGGNGIIVGAPGIGKTFLLKNFCTECINKNIKCLYLPVDRLSVAKESEFLDELNIKTDLIDYLKKQNTNDEIGYVIIDGFDAARTENNRNFYLNLIRRLIKNLHGSWNILVSIRIYDAQKSGNLIDLFPKNYLMDTTTYQIDNINCRHFAVPKLSHDEIKDSLDDMPHFKEIYNNGSPDLKDILRVPFNIWLLEKVLESEPNFYNLSYITSEVQLLELFWKYWVADGFSGDSKQIVLTKITRNMVNKHSMYVRKENVYDINYAKVWDLLFSSEILTHFTPDKQKVTFSHNILFDYAVSILLIDDDFDELTKFINQDLSRPLFLRPSLNYYFARLWYDEPKIFWRNFWNLFTSEDEKLHLFSRLMPIKTIAEETKELNELNPLFKFHDDTNVHKAISKLIQALIALELQNDELWVKFLNKSMRIINIEFARDLAVMTSHILKRSLETNDEKIIKCCGKISRSLLNWIWIQRLSNKNNGTINFLARLAIPLVIQTYETNTTKSRELLGKIIEIIDEKNFPVNLVFKLVSDLDKIWSIDPEFAADVYKSVFRYQETSDAIIPFGTPIVPLSSTRRQDYEMCYYVLIKHFPNFIRSSPLIAIQSGIESLNSYIIETQVICYLDKGINLNEIIEKFNFKGKDAEYIPDGSFIWDQDIVRNEPLKIGNEIFKFISDPDLDRNIISSLLDIFAENANVAFFWKRLLELGSKNPDVYANHLYELCLAIPVQICLETTYALTEFLERSSKNIEEEKLAEIEKSILNIPNIENNLEKDYLKHRRDRYLSQIPYDLLRYEESRIIIEEIKSTGEIPTNQPIVKFGEVTTERYTEEKLLKDSGVNVEKPENKNLYAFFPKIEKFNTEFRNEIPDKKQIKLNLAHAQKFYDTLCLDENADKEVFKLSWTKLATFCEIISRRDTNPESDEFKFCRKVLLYCSNHPEPRPNPEYDSKYSSAHWSPAPRNEAAMGLLWLAHNNADKEILEAIERLIFDEVPSVRYLVVSHLYKLLATNPNVFWSFAEQIANSEENIVVQTALLNNLLNAVKIDEFKTTKILRILKNRLNLDEDSDLQRSFANIIIGLLFVRDNHWAKEISEELLNDPVKNSKLLEKTIFQTFQYIDTKKYDSMNLNELKKPVEWLMRVIDSVGAIIEELHSSRNQKLNQEEYISPILKEMYGILDQIVTRIYFAADVRRGSKKITNTERKNFYFYFKPLLEKIVAIQVQNEFMFSGTAYYFLELLNGVIEYDPADSLHMASEIINAAKSTGFHADHLALNEVVNLIEVLLADHRNEIKNSQSLKDLISILDIFADMGWPDAINLFWRLDEIFR